MVEEQSGIKRFYPSINEGISPFENNFANIFTDI